MPDVGAKVAIVMGSQSDWETMTGAVEVLDEQDQLEQVAAMLVEPF